MKLRNALQYVPNYNYFNVC